jgi:hypothetical protein
MFKMPGQARRQPGRATAKRHDMRPRPCGPPALQRLAKAASGPCDIAAVGAWTTARYQGIRGAGADTAAHR